MLITLDTTRADRLGCYGYGKAKTPTLDGLAARGVRFADAVTVAPITLPSHATILTGLIPPHHGARHNGEFRLSDEHETLAEILGSHGYDTAAFISAFVLDARFGLSQGFAHYDDQVGVTKNSNAAVFMRTMHERSAERVTDAAKDWLSQHPSDRPFFCWVHYFDPHGPYDPPAPYATRHAGRPYDGEIAYMDSQIGRLMNALETQGATNNTLVMIVADHGESLGEHGEATHAKLIYESVMHVPLILSCPGLLDRGAVIDDVVVSVTDVFPTVLDLLGIKSSRSIDGKSLLTAHTDRTRTVYLETLAPYMDHGWSPLYGLRRHEDKYILAPKREFYDLRKDPGELRNLQASVSGVAKTARDALASDLTARMAKWPTAETVAASAEPLDADARRRLESLGYVGSSEEGGGESASLPDPKDMIPLMKALDQATGLATSGRNEEALHLLRQILTASPGDRNTLFALAKLYLQMNRIAEAEDTFRKSHSIKPSPRVCIFLAQIMIADGRIEEAEQMLDAAESLSPRHGGIFLARGDLHVARRQPDEAIAAYERAKRVDPYRAADEADRRIKQLREFLRSMRTP